MTPPEQLLWWKLRGKQFQNLKFRRQHGIGPYIVDFYCPDKSVAIELDGESHSDDRQIRIDREREEYLLSLGVRVIRYYNEDVRKNMEGLLEDLAGKLDLSLLVNSK